MNIRVMNALRKVAAEPGTTQQVSQTGLGKLFDNLRSVFKQSGGGGTNTQTSASPVQPAPQQQQSSPQQQQQQQTVPANNNTPAAPATSWTQQNPHLWGALKWGGGSFLGGSILSSLFGAKNPLGWGLLLGLLGTGYGLYNSGFFTRNKNNNNNNNNNNNPTTVSK